MLPPRKVMSDIGEAAMNALSLKKILLENNPMEQRKIKINFPSKKLSPMNFKKPYIRNLQKQEKLGWSFMSNYQE